MTRGLRNRNPLNIRRSSTRWLGEAKEQTDRQFVQFRCMLMGYRAAFRLLRTYIQVYRLTTVPAIINRWAPPADGNDTQSYIDIVCRYSGLAPAQPLAYADKPSLTALVAAMARVESGITDPDRAMLDDAYELAK